MPSHRRNNIYYHPVAYDSKLSYTRRDQRGVLTVQIHNHTLESPTTTTTTTQVERAGGEYANKLMADMFTSHT